MRYREFHQGTVLVGDRPGSGYGKIAPKSLRNITIWNVEGNNRHTVNIKGYLCDSEISEIRSAVNGSPVLTHFEGQLENVSIH